MKDEPAATDSGDAARSTKQPRGLLFVALLLLSNIVLFGLLAYSSQDEVRRWLGRDDPARAEHDSTVKQKDASHTADDDADAVVTISANAQRAGGITTTKLTKAVVAVSQSTPSREQVMAATGMNASVPNVATLFDLRARHQAQQSDVATARIALSKSAADLRRMQALHADDRNVSVSALEAVQAQYRSDQARLLQAQTAATGTLDAIRQSWGVELANAVRGNDHSRLLQRLASREQVLVQVGMMRAGPPPEQVWLSTIDAGDVTDSAFKDSGNSQRREQIASLVGPAVATDPSLPATTFLYRTEPGSLRSGARLRVRMSTGTKENEAGSSAALLPFSAVIWHAGQAWAYVAQGKTERGVRFERRTVDTRDETVTGWVQSERFSAGDEVVTGGAQWLLSKELKPRALDND